ncbi:pyridoxal-phosphate dependent enzyme [Flavobacterium sp.]|uniref:1-aminocyclopropane-1-carboxylate deaminase/D-cysteine desulfhydrase n=1 Tax=Flavobacterium sp. TaxID=239 RepID=UPI0028BE6277|nr:pyridoxal-phosphate dependent enzyme [Flavobacterium sp.]
MKSFNQQIQYDLPNNISLVIKREDLLHPDISGNKFRKLKYNIEKAKASGFTKLVTFGGAFSNHILATAAAGSVYDLATIGIIRGEELAFKIAENPTLSRAKELGMQLVFIPREAYQEKDSESFLRDVKLKYSDAYLVPEGGTNPLAVKGCEEILTDEDAVFDYVCCAVGTGGTISGLINSSAENQKVLGFPALKGSFLFDDIRRFARNDNWNLIQGYEFGGYAKISPELVHFLNDFYEKTEIPLDPIYTGKMMFGILDMIRQGKFPEHSKIVAIHTGGLQGIQGMNQHLLKKNLPIINY